MTSIKSLRFKNKSIWIQLLALASVTCAVHGQNTFDTGSRLVNRSSQSALKQISVDDFGAIDDGNTDNSAAFAAAFAATPPGVELLFPCSGAGNYKVNSPLSFPGYHTYRGGGRSCRISSMASGTAAFNFVGADSITLMNLRFYSANSSTPPKTVMNFGRTNSNVAAAHHNFFNIQVDGFASVAVIYSIASEEQRWYDPEIFLNGGGAKYLFFTSDSDELGVCACATASNTDIRFYGPHLADFSTFAQNHVLFYVGGNISGDISVHGGYAGFWKVTDGASGFAFIPSHGNILIGNITVDNLRLENAAYFASIEGAVFSIHLTNNTFSSAGAVNFVHTSNPSNSLVRYSEFRNNNNGDSNISSSFGVLDRTTIFESFPVNSTYTTKSFIVVPTGSSSALNPTTDNFIQDGSGTKLNQLNLSGVKSITGTRFVCTDTNGNFSSSVTPCKGT